MIMDLNRRRSFPLYLPLMMICFITDGRCLSWSVCNDQPLEYAITAEGMQWSRARAVCSRSDDGATLATPRNRLQRGCIRQLIEREQQAVWIGISKSNTGNFPVVDNNDQTSRLSKQDLNIPITEQTGNNKGSCKSATAKEGRQSLRDKVSTSLKVKYSNCSKQLKAVCQRPVTCANPATYHLILVDQLAQSHHGDRFSVNSSLRVTCRHGFRPAKPDYLMTCDSTGHWQPEPEKCQPYLCTDINGIDPMSLRRTGDSYQHNGALLMKYMYVLRKNFEEAKRETDMAKDTSDERFCFLTNNTEVVQSFCHHCRSEVSLDCFPIDCSYPQCLNNGEVTTTGLTYRSNISYFCIPGFQTDNHTNGQCLENGRWSISPPLCQVCPSNTWEKHCERQCTCAHSVLCHPRNGVCNCSTAFGYFGRMCNENCQNGTFGTACSSKCICSEGQNCGHVTGNCMNNYSSTSPTAQESRVKGSHTTSPGTSVNSTVILVTASIGCYILGFGSAIFIFWWKKRRQTESLGYTEDAQENAPTTLRSVAFSMTENTMYGQTAITTTQLQRSVSASLEPGTDNPYEFISSGNHRPQP